ncbi:hypothetical protein C5167_044022 [Papaver somniferum]|uniref:Uncharacterized protein n=1 Tax=Papaver somniferum TaxID=3469 RepID=A0A4Y7L7D5_PAPSO|nr:hypothetical protein C5167_044022 [Papaver somniferum]
MIDYIVIRKFKLIMILGYSGYEVNDTVGTLDVVSTMIIGTLCGVNRCNDQVSRTTYKFRRHGILFASL